MVRAWNRNVKSAKLGGIKAEVAAIVGSLEIVTAITRASEEQMDLKLFDEVTANTVMSRCKSSVVC
jgi:hypothetical protein